MGKAVAVRHRRFAHRLGRLRQRRGNRVFHPAHLGYVIELTERVPFRWSTVYFPRGEAPTPTFVQTHPYMIPQTTAHPDAAWEWLKFLTTSTYASEIRAEYLALPGTFAAVDFVVERTALPPGISVMDAFGPHMYPTEYSVKVPTAPAYQRAVQDVGFWNVVREVVIGERDAATAMREIEPAMLAIIQEMSGR